MSRQYCVDANVLITTWYGGYPPHVFRTLWKQLAQCRNDITLIAYAMVTGKTVVTFEGEQPQKPGKKCNYKIPLICHEQSVECINFVAMLDRLGIRT